MESPVVVSMLDAGSRRFVVKCYGAIGAVLGFVFGGVTGPFIAWFIMERLVQRIPIVSGSGLVFFGLWGANVLFVTPAFAGAGMLQRRFETFLEGEHPRQDPL